eukprot:scaffold34656_cov73-Isochrysis_galbana.AAC.2
MTGTRLSVPPPVSAGARAAVAPLPSLSSASMDLQKKSADAGGSVAVLPPPVFSLPSPPFPPAAAPAPPPPSS